jgi:hypothetical protein
MAHFKFDHLKDLTYRVIDHVIYELINHIKGEMKDIIVWEHLISDAKTNSPFAFVFKYEASFFDFVRESWLKADLNGRKIKKAAFMFSEEFEGLNQTHESEYYDEYNETDFRKAIKYTLFHFHQQLVE